MPIVNNNKTIVPLKMYQLREELIAQTGNDKAIQIKHQFTIKHIFPIHLPYILHLFLYLFQQPQFVIHDI